MIGMAAYTELNTPFYIGALYADFDVRDAADLKPCHRPRLGAALAVGGRWRAGPAQQERGQQRAVPRHQRVQLRVVVLRQHPRRSDHRRVLALDWTRAPEAVLARG